MHEATSFSSDVTCSIFWVDFIARECTKVIASLTTSHVWQFGRFVFAKKLQRAAPQLHAATCCQAI